MLPTETEQNFVRYPTEHEIKELKLCVAQNMVNEVTDEDLEDAGLLVENACIAVFPNYVTDSLGYSGRVMTVVFGGGPYTRAAYTWDEDGRIELVDDHN